jgi:selenocysteine-specific elongation factor
VRHGIVGTAGHVDHGKTTLIRALTGVNTDRLREEQERGMSIELGFAPLALPSGRVAGVVDVPGHERFIKNMLAGATGVDVAILVAAADEGVMPQTDEHLNILHLLGVKHGVVAVTKADLVESDWLELVKEDVRARLSRTSLARAPIVAVSAVTGQGLSDLVSAIDHALDCALAASEPWSFSRLPVDRVFAAPGLGTVVTGTLSGGRVRPGDRLELLPPGREVRVRGIEVHGTPQEEAVRGQRVALNLSGVDRADIERGMVLAAPGRLVPSTLVDAELQILPEAAPVAHMDRLRVHLGTAEIMCRVRIIGSDEILSGMKGFVQLDLEQPVVAGRGDRFIVRAYSPATTVGGGRVLSSVTFRQRRHRPETLRDFEALAGDDLLETAALFVRRLGFLRSPHSRRAPVEAAAVARAAGIEDSAAERVLGEATVSGILVQLGDDSSPLYLPRSDHDELIGDVVTLLKDFHARAPLRPGMPREELRTRISPSWEGKVFASLIAAAEARGILKQVGAAVSAPEHVPTLSAEQATRARELEKMFADALLSPPNREEALARLGLHGSGTRSAEPILDYLIDLGVLVRVGPELLFHREALSRASEIARELGSEGRAFTAGEFRDRCGNTRKFAVALLEYLDGARVTKRVGDSRVLARCQR